MKKKRVIIDDTEIGELIPEKEPIKKKSKAKKIPSFSVTDTVFKIHGNIVKDDRIHLYLEKLSEHGNKIDWSSLPFDVTEYILYLKGMIMLTYPEFDRFNKVGNRKENKLTKLEEEIIKKVQDLPAGKRKTQYQIIQELSSEYSESSIKRALRKNQVLENS